MSTTHKGDRDAGFTLVELLVVVILLGIVSAIVSTGVITAMKATRTQSDETMTLNSAKTAIERITREIRGANAFTDCEPRTMSFTYSHDGLRTAITFTVTAVNATSSNIVETKAVTTLATGTTTTQTLQVLGGLAIGQSDAVFTYSDAGGTLLTPQSTSPESYNPGAVKSVGVKVLMRRIGSHPSVQLYQLVSIRNLEV